MIMTGTHDQTLVALSILLAMFASFTALSLASRVRASTGWNRRLWLLAAAVALGGGIWSMHFVAMLAFSMPGMEASYDPWLTIMSLAIALVFTGLGFAVMNRGHASAARVASAGLLMGSGVAAMHYLGMAAMRMPATLDYERGWLAVSVLIAIGAAIAAVWLASRDRHVSHQAAAAGAMGMAIAGMHYAGMRAAVFTSSPTVDGARDVAGVGQTQLAAIVTAVTVLILLLGLGAARIERIVHGATRREARSTLRLKVADLLRGQDMASALEEVAGLLGIYFGVSRTGYGQLDAAADMFDYDVCWTDGSVPPLIGRLPAAAFGVKIVAALSARETVAVGDLLEADIGDEERTRATAREADTRAILVVPFLHGGRLRTILYLNDRNPRTWRADEVRFLEEIAERIRLVIERVAVEEQLRAFNASLEARVAAEVDARMRTEEALRQSQKVEAIGQLTGGVAHDFNNLLTVIRGSVDLLRRPGISEERRAHYINAIALTADRATRLTSQLLAFARRQTLKPETFDVAVGVTAVRTMIDTLVGSRIEVDLVVPDEPCFVHADPSQLDTAIVNMAVNARDAMVGAGRIRISVGAADRIPAVRNHPPVDGEYVTVAVADNGSGIAPQALPCIFEPFFTTKAVGEGTGLGLSQVFGFAKQSGGDVTVESEPGSGSVFTIYLPRTVASPAPEPAGREEGDTPEQGATCVLVVEDNAEVRQFATSTLAELGYSTVASGNAAEALALLREDASRFDVVFSDVVMPGMSGLELARIIREQHADLPVIITSGYSDVLAQEGTDGFDLLHKPYSVDQLSRALRKAVVEKHRRGPS